MTTEQVLEQSDIDGLELINPAFVEVQRKYLVEKLAWLENSADAARLAQKIADEHHGSVSVSVYDCRYRVQLYGVTDLKVAIPILRELAQHGHHAVKGREFWEDDEKCYRVYDRGEISLWLQLGSGGTCKRVQVGTKEVPVYEIQCDE